MIIQNIFKMRFTGPLGGSLLGLRILKLLKRVLLPCKLILYQSMCLMCFLIEAAASFACRCFIIHLHCIWNAFASDMLTCVEHVFKQLFNFCLTICLSVCLPFCLMFCLTEWLTIGLRVGSQSVSLWGSLSESQKSHWDVLRKASFM